MALLLLLRREREGLRLSCIAGEAWADAVLPREKDRDGVLRWLGQLLARGPLAQENTPRAAGPHGGNH